MRRPYRPVRACGAGGARCVASRGIAPIAQNAPVPLQRFHGAGASFAAALIGTDCKAGGWTEEARLELLGR
jgi:hypothetical protein